MSDPDTQTPIAHERLGANLRLLQKHSDLSDASITAIRAAVEDSMLTLVAINPSMPPEFRFCNTCANWPNSRIAICEKCNDLDKWEAR